jgi:myo-inositol 2-dehydrogenase/D-chiro-inositol 1-dehydrogenase
LHIGLLGAGRIGAFHAGTLADLARVEAITLWDPRTDVAKTVAAAVGARVASSPDDLLGEQLDALLICSSSTTHDELLTSAVHKGIPTFCEKPVATTLDATARLLGLVESAGVPVTVGFQRRSDPGYQALRERVAGLGTLYLARLVSADEAPPPAAYLATSGGVFVDQSVHDFDILRYVTGQEITEVYAAGAALTGADGFAETGDADTAVTVLKLSGGAIASLTSSRHSAAGYDVRFELTGSEGVVSVGVPVQQHGHDGVAEVSATQGGFLSMFADAYRVEMDRFLDHVQGVGANPCSVRDAHIAFTVALAVTKSRRSGVPVLVSDVSEREYR